MMKRTKGEKIFAVINTLFLIFFTICMIYPIIYVAAASFSTPDEINMGNVWMLPKGFTTEAYKAMFKQTGVVQAYMNSILYLTVGSFVQIFVTICGAYPLSRKDLPGRRFFNFAVILTMWLNPGLIPTYLNFNDLGILNTRIGYIIGFACGAYNFVILRSFFESIPDALEEAAKLDGASDIYILSKIFIPLSMSAIATVWLFYAVSRWNGYFWGMLFFKDDAKMPLQVLLRTLVVEMSGKSQLAGANVDMSQMKTSEENVTYATIMITVLPMLIIYPYIQKFFVKGVMIGSVKG